MRVADESVNLFDRIPERLFRPLGATDHVRRYWAMLCHLYDDFFAPGAAPPEGDGWSQRKVIASLELFLQRWEDRHGADGEESGAPLNIRASDSLRYLVETDWLAFDQVGFLQFVIMRPTVQSLFELLRNFSEQGPDFISGRVQSIRNNLRQVKADPRDNAAVFPVAAKECAAMLQMLNTTRMRVREASDHLRELDSTPAFLEHFFGDYIASLYIGDYADLFSRNHPLTARWDIIELVADITELPDSRAALRQWYQKNYRCKDQSAADQLIDRDTESVQALRKVDRLLSQLQDAVTRANDEALGYLNYQVRSQGDFSSWVGQAIDALVRANDAGDGALSVPLGWSAGRLLSNEGLRLPAGKPKERTKAVIRKRALSPEQQVRRYLRQIMRGNREVSDERILRYIDRHLPQEGSVTTSELAVASINDLCILASFSRLGLLAVRAEARAQGKPGRHRPLTVAGGRIVIEPTGRRFGNAYLEAPEVRIHRINQRK